MDIRLAGQVFDVTVAGPDDGPVVLLLHGFPQSAHCWRLVVPALVTRGFRVLAPDQRGYSPRARPTGPEDYRLPGLVLDALGVLDELDVKQAHVVGHDWGAAVAWQLGARHAARVRTLTTVSVPHPRAFIEALRNDPDQRQRSLYMREFATAGYEEQLLADDGAALVRIFDDAGPDVDVQDVLRRAAEPGSLRAWLRWYADQRLEDVGDTPAVDVPTMHVWSDGDAALGRAGALGTAAWVTGPYRLEVLTGVSHWIPEQAAEELSQLLLTHLR